MKSLPVNIFFLSMLFGMIGCSTHDRMESAPLPDWLQLQTIEGAAVTTEWRARDIALASAWKTDGGMSATTSFRVNPCFKLEFDVPGFAKNGERVWQVEQMELSSFDQSRRTFWINAENGAIKVIAGKRALCSQEGATVAKESQAESIAMAAAGKADGGSPATTWFLVNPCFKVEFDVPGFAKNGERVWQVEESSYGRFQSRRTFWVNAENSAIKMLADERTICSQVVEYDAIAYTKTRELIRRNKPETTSEAAQATAPSVADPGR